MSADIFNEQLTCDALDHASNRLLGLLLLLGEGKQLSPSVCAFVRLEGTLVFAGQRVC